MNTKKKPGMFGLLLVIGSLMSLVPFGVSAQDRAFRWSGSCQVRYTNQFSRSGSCQVRGTDGQYRYVSGSGYVSTSSESDAESQAESQLRSQASGQGTVESVSVTVYPN